MKEVSVTLTDFAITALTAFFCYQLATVSGPADMAITEHSEIRLSFICLFGALAVASFLGGLVHGFLHDPDSRLTQAVWVLTLLSVGVAAYNLWMVNLYFVSAPILVWGWVFRILFVVYVFVVFFVSQKYSVAIASYVPPAALLFVFLAGRALPGAGIKATTGTEIYGALGLFLTFVAAYIQQAQISLHPKYLNYNTIYHLVQAVGLTGLFIFAKEFS